MRYFHNHQPLFYPKCNSQQTRGDFLLDTGLRNHPGEHLICCGTALAHTIIFFLRQKIGSTLHFFIGLSFGDHDLIIYCRQIVG